MQLLHVDIFEERASTLSCLPVTRAGELHRLCDVLQGIEERQQIVCLKNETDPGESQPAQVAAEVLSVEDGFALELHRTARGFGHAADHVEQRALAATGRAA